MGDRLKILFFHRPVDPNDRPYFAFPYALDKYADVTYCGYKSVHGNPWAFTIEKNPTKSSDPWQTYGHLVRHEKFPKDYDTLEIIKKLYPNDYPDAVLITLLPGYFNYIPNNFGKCKCIRVAWSLEIHNTFSRSKRGQLRLKFVKDNVNLIFKNLDPNNRLNGGKLLANTGVAVEMNPACINTDFFYDKQLPKEYDVANIFGYNSPKIYPLRWKIHETLTKQKQWSYRNACYQWNKGKRVIASKSAPRGEKYVEAICKGRVFATGSGRHKNYGILVRKWLEVPACNTLLMIDKLSPPDDMDAMGFEPDINFVAINEDNYLDRIQYYLNHPSEAEKISQRGYDLIRSKHSQDIRAKQFLNKIKEHM